MATARRTLGVPARGEVIALLPGSRASEVEALARMTERSGFVLRERLTAHPRMQELLQRHQAQRSRGAADGADGALSTGPQQGQSSTATLTNRRLISRLKAFVRTERWHEPYDCKPGYQQ